MPGDFDSVMEAYATYLEGRGGDVGVPVGDAVFISASAYERQLCIMPVAGYARTYTIFRYVGELPGTD